MSKEPASATAAKTPMPLNDVCQKLGIGNIKRHMFICLGPKCCSAEAGEQAWTWLKARLKEPDMRDRGVFRTRVGCLQVCQQGPVAVVYPEGTWYKLASPEVCAEIVESHLKNGVPVDRHSFAVNPL